jgi:hypothetical protein
MNDLFTPASVSKVSDGNGAGNEDLAWNWAVYSSSMLYNCGWQWGDPGAPGGVWHLLAVHVVPGAEWIWSQLLTAPTVTSTRITVPGATDAYYRCDTGNGTCWADALVNHTWIQVSLATKNTAGDVDALIKALTELAAYSGA